MNPHVHSHPTQPSDPFSANFLHRSEGHDLASAHPPKQNLTLALNAFHKDLLEFVNLCNGLLVSDVKKELKTRKKNHQKYTKLQTKIRRNQKEIEKKAPSNQKAKNTLNSAMQAIQLFSFANHFAGTARQEGGLKNYLALGANTMLTVPTLASLFKSLLGEKYGAFLPELTMFKNNQFLTTTMFLAAQFCLNQAGLNLSEGMLPISPYLHSLLGVTQIGIKCLSYYFEDKKLQFQAELAKFQAENTSLTNQLDEVKDSFKGGTPLDKNNKYFLEFLKQISKGQRDISSAIERILAQKV